MNIIYQIMALAGGLFFIALSFSLGNVNSLVIDFTQFPPEQLSVYRYVFFTAGVGLWLAIPILGD